MQGLYPNDASMLDSIGRLMIVALFVIIGLRNLQKVHIDDHIARLTKFKAPFPKATFWIECEPISRDIWVRCSQW